MRGNPILRALFLSVALCLAGALVAAVVHNRTLPAGPPPEVSPAPAAASSLVPTYLTLTLSAPASSLTLTEPDGRLVAIPLSGALIHEHEAELAFSDDNTYRATVTIAWHDPAAPRFLHLALEPDNLPTRELTLHPTAPKTPLHIHFTP